MFWDCVDGNEEEVFFKEDSISAVYVETQGYNNDKIEVFDDTPNYERKILSNFIRDSLEIRALAECVLSIYNDCSVINAISLDSLEQFLCKFVPYGLSISAAGKFPNGKESMMLRFSCWDSSDLVSRFILLPRDSKYCDTIKSKFFLAWHIIDSNRQAFMNIFNEESLKAAGVGYVLVHIANNVDIVYGNVVDIELDIWLKDTIDIALLYIDLHKQRGFMCVDSNVIVDNYEGFRKIGRVCYVKYPHACLWK